MGAHANDLALILVATRKKPDALRGKSGGLHARFPGCAGYQYPFLDA